MKDSDYTRLKISPSAKATLEAANAEVARFGSAGRRLTTSQLFRRLADAGRLPGGSTHDYRQFAHLVGKARVLGLMPWDCIHEDLSARLPPAHGSAAQAVRRLAEDFRLDRWATQPVRIEVWSQTSAGVEFARQACEVHALPVVPCGGYPPVGEVMACFHRLKPFLGRQDAVILYLGDFGPYGLSIEQDVRRKLSGLSNGRIRLERVCLTPALADRWGVPPRKLDAKSNTKAYRGPYGDLMWELEAARPADVEQELDACVRKYRDDEAWDATLAREKAEREKLEALTGRI